MTTPDPMAQRADTRVALASPAYLDAFNAIMSGRGESLPPEQSAAVRLVRELTGHDTGGLPMPTQTPDTLAPPEPLPAGMITEDGAR
jgi:hypothetical protein